VAWTQGRCTKIYIDVLFALHFQQYQSTYTCNITGTTLLLYCVKLQISLYSIHTQRHLDISSTTFRRPSKVLIFRHISLCFLYQEYFYLSSYRGEFVATPMAMTVILPISTSPAVLTWDVETSSSQYNPNFNYLLFYIILVPSIFLVSLAYLHYRLVFHIAVTKSVNSS
jgi:hypothetical protein